MEEVISKQDSHVTTITNFLPGIDPTVVAEAVANLRSGKATLIAMSGWQGSGKDTIAPALLEEWGFAGVTQMSFATALRSELNEIITVIRRAVPAGTSTLRDVTSRSEVAQAIATNCRMTVQEADRYFSGEFATEVLNDAAVTPATRSIAVRGALQALGTEVRRARDVNYWARPPLYAALPLLAQGKSVYFSDARFSNEADGIRLAGGMVLRLDVTPEVQAERIWARDRIRIDPASRTHASEVALDDYVAFDARVSNDGTVEDTLAALLGQLPPRGVFRVPSVELPGDRQDRLTYLAGLPAGWLDGAGQPMSRASLRQAEEFLEVVAAVDPRAARLVPLFPHEEGVVAVEWYGRDGFWSADLPGDETICIEHRDTSGVLTQRVVSLRDAAVVFAEMFTELLPADV